MNVLWDLDSAYMRDVIQHYPEPKPHPNTISTFLKILVEKDFLTTEKEGRIFRYTVAIPYKVYRKFLTINFVDQHYRRSGIELVKMLLEEKLITPKNIQEIVSLKPEEVDSRKFKQKESEISEYIEEITAPRKKKTKKAKKSKKESSRMDENLTVKKKKKKK